MAPRRAPRPRVDNATVKALARAHRWRRLLEGERFRSLRELAAAEGAHRGYVARLLRLTLLAPGLVASGVYAFLQAWNEFTVALVLLPSGSMHTLPLWLRGFVQASATHEIDWGQVMAASTLVAVPVIVFFVIVQGRLTSGLVAGAVKG